MSRALQLAALAGLAIILWVLYLYRKGKLKEDYAILWVSVSAAIVLLSIWTDLLLAVNLVVNAERTSDIVLAAFIAFLLVICIYYSARLSELTEQNRKIAQEIAILRANSKQSVFSSEIKNSEEK
jgi:hypothetical protein